MVMGNAGQNMHDFDHSTPRHPCHHIILTLQSIPMDATRHLLRQCGLKLKWKR